MRESDPPTVLSSSDFPTYLQFEVNMSSQDMTENTMAENDSDNIHAPDIVTPADAIPAEAVSGNNTTQSALTEDAIAKNTIFEGDNDIKPGLCASGTPQVDDQAKAPVKIQMAREDTMRADQGEDMSTKEEDIQMTGADAVKEEQGVSENEALPTAGAPNDSSGSAPTAVTNGCGFSASTEGAIEPAIPSVESNGYEGDLSSVTAANSPASPTLSNHSRDSSVEIVEVRRGASSTSAIEDEESVYFNERVVDSTPPSIEPAGNTGKAPSILKQKRGERMINYAATTTAANVPPARVSFRSVPYAASKFTLREMLQLKGEGSSELSKCHH